jgi:hypothetical protein
MVISEARGIVSFLQDGVRLQQAPPPSIGGRNPFTADEGPVMHKLIAGIFSILMALPVFAQDAPPVAAPPVDADPTGLILFALVLVGMIGGFAWYIVVKERAKSQSK